MILKLFKLTNRFGRRGTIDLALELFHREKGTLIVEIGTICNPLPRAKIFDGHSTFAWAMHGKKVFSVDHDGHACSLARSLLSEYSNVQVINDDGIRFLKEFEQSIDLLYLDAWDGEPDCRTKHLIAYQVAKKNLHDCSLILVDDAFSKASFLVSEIVRDGWSIVFNEYQVLLAGPGIYNFNETFQRVVKKEAVESETVGCDSVLEGSKTEFTDCANTCAKGT